ncbi:MAG: NAD-dependent epimerase/dehydratase family protein [Pararhizobium sp.]
MTYLVTGGTGFIGSNIVELLLQAGKEVVAFSNAEPNERQRRLLSKQGDPIFVQGDVRDQELLERLIGEHRIERMIHGAVITSSSDREKNAAPLIVDVNLVGAAAAASAACRAGIARFVLVGSAGVYSTQDLPDGSVVTEEQPHSVETLYGIGKSAAELIVRRVCALHGQSFAIGRVATAFGRWEHDTGHRDTLSPLHQLTQKARTGEVARLARDKSSNWHYGRDAAAALIALADAEAPKFTDYNLGPHYAWRLGAWCSKLSGRFKDFRYEIGGSGNINLYGDNDGALLSWQRFSAEFGPTARFDLDAAFDDYMSWLEA